MKRYHNRIPNPSRMQEGQCMTYDMLTFYTSLYMYVCMYIFAYIILLCIVVCVCVNY